MKILVTGANGFVGKNLIAELKNLKYNEIFEFDIDTDPKLLDTLLILGNTNSALSAISAKRLKVPIFHMEVRNRCH
jgi:UDP-N-acetylglucosamine 2-epimerase